MMKISYSRRHLVVGAVASAAVLTVSGKAMRAATPVVHDVKMKGFAFSPKALNVSIGDTIRWTNEDLAPHTATADEGGWDTGEIANGASVSVEVTKGMETSYFCAFHPRMKGEIAIV